MNLYLVSIPMDVVIEKKIFDLYALHKVVYTLFDQHRTAEELSTDKSSELNWLELDDTPLGKRLLIQTSREIKHLDFVSIRSKKLDLNFKAGELFGFSILVNPAHRGPVTPEMRLGGKRGQMIVPKSHEEVESWFRRRASDFGFEVQSLVVGGIQYVSPNPSKGVSSLVVSPLTGRLRITDVDLFMDAVKYGIGRARTYGCGLLQIKKIQSAE